ncbi:hypothetical protein VP01_65g10 [Puccinia sorghi]|uniref:Uncharacterized protein n=1 Tax=Puccinia sorghi TaxID=27349 RepID=A0A0L6UF69_9BASI|nr:hypothetical protein VP01_65g10 [Puccinia sorghi]
MAGFNTFGKFFLACTNWNSEFPLLAKLDNETLLRQYYALMNQFKQIKDHTDQ